MAGAFELLDQQPLEDNTTSFERGLRSGLTSAGGQLNALAGGVGEAVGASDFARNRYAASQAAQEQAAAEAPQIGSYGQVHDLSSGYDYITGKAGQMIPAAAAMIGAAALTRGRGGLPGSVAAGTVATAPLEAGSIIQEQQADPVSLAASPAKRLGTALGGGTVSAAMQNVVPLALGGKFAGRVGAEVGKDSVKTILARNAAEGVVGNAAANVGAELVHQNVGAMTNENRDTSHDTEHLREAAISGAVLGAPFGALGAAGDFMHGRAANAGTSVRELAGGAKDLLGDAKDAASKKFTGLFNKDTTKDDATARAVADDKLVEPLVPGADKEAHVASSDAKATEWATTKLKGWLEDSSIDPETKAKAADLLTKVGDHAARAEVATMDLARKTSKQATDFYDHMTKGDGASEMKDKLFDTAKTVQDHVTDFMTKTVPARAKATRDSIETLLKSDNIAGDVKERLQAAAANIQDTAEQAWVAGIAKANELRGGAKKSEDYSGVRAAIVKEIAPSIEASRPEALKDPASMNRIAEGVRLYIDRARQGMKPESDATTVAYMRKILGPDAEFTLLKIFDAIHEATPLERENMHESLDALNEHMVAHNSMADAVTKYAEKNAQLDVPSAVEALRKYTRGEHVKGAGPAETAFREKAVRRELETVFGKNTDKVLELFQKEHEATKAKTALDQEGKPLSDEADLEDAKNQARGGVEDRTLTEGDPQYEEPRYYGSKDKGLIPTHQAHVRDFGNSDSQANRQLERAKKDNPDRNVSFMKARDFARERGISEQELHEMTGGKPDDFGVVAAEGMKQEGRITEADARAMLLDSKGRARSASRIDTDQPGVTLDAYKITSNTMKTLGYIDGESNIRRTARAFFEGLGSALIHFDAKLPEAIKDSTIIARRNGIDVTFADVKEFRFQDPMMSEVKLGGDNEHIIERGGLKELNNDYLAQMTLDLHERYDALYQKYKDNYGAGESGYITEKQYAAFRKHDAVTGVENLLSKVRDEIQNRNEREYSSNMTEHYRAALPEKARTNLKHLSQSLSEIREELGITGVANANIDPKAEIHLAVKQHGEGSKLQVKTGLDDNALNKPVKNQVVATREALVREVTDSGKPLSSFKVETKLYNKDGKEIVWTDKKEDNPGLLTADKAVSDIHDRVNTIDMLLKCLKG